MVIWLAIKLLRKLRKSQVSRSSPQNSSETATNETEIPKGRYIYPQKRQNIIDCLELT